jgi:predicted aldo/keto reductase-like oxidoreductase
MEDSLMASRPTAGPRADAWTIATDDTRLTVGATTTGQLCIYELSNPAAGWNWTAEPSVLALLGKAGIGLVAMKVMAPAKPGGASDAPQMKSSAGPLAALKWVVKHPSITTTIPSMTDADQLEMNVRAVSEQFSAQDAKVLARLDEEIRPLYCRMCSACRGQCPKGVPVADTIRFLTYADFYGQFDLGRERFLELPEAVRGVRCNDCSSCAVQCPNGVRVAERLSRAQELFA